jgi:hypothetical protein
MITYLQEEVDRQQRVHHHFFEFLIPLVIYDFQALEGHLQ